MPLRVKSSRLKLSTAAALAIVVLASGAHLAPNGLRPASAQAATGRVGGGAPGILDQALLTAVTAAKATGALEAIEGSLVYLSAKYEIDTEEQRSAAPPHRPHEHQSESEGLGGARSLPPASAGTNGTTVPPPSGEVDEPLVARAPSATDGPTATYVSGIALAPPDAPERVAGAVNAANTIVGRPYIWGGGHDSWYARGYDCSGAVSFALAGGGFLASPLTSSQLASWGAPGPGRWITIYASASHVYAVIAGLRWDTVGDARGTGPRWHVAGAVPDGFVARHPPGY